MGPVVAVAQLPSSLGDVDENLRRLEEAARRAAEQTIDLVVFPECHLTGYMFENAATARAHALVVDGPEIEAVRRICRSTRIEIVIGFLERDGDRMYNSAALVGPDGVMGVHRKRRLPPLGADRFAARPGPAEPSVFKSRIGCVGIAICYEVRFAEIFSGLALAGADIIAMPVLWRDRSTLLADAFARVRAAENFVYLLVANRGDSHLSSSYLGRSQIIDPHGTVMCQMDRAEGLASARIDLDLSRRKTLPYLTGDPVISPWDSRAG